LEVLPEVSAGNVFGIGGLEGHLLKNGTLSSTKLDVKNMAGISQDAHPILRVALEPENPTEMDKLVEGLRLLNQADPCVQVMLQETGEHVILTAGELHLERCLRDLKERFAKINIHVSPPIVPFRESIVVNPEVAMVKTSGPEATAPPVPRGTLSLTTTSKWITLDVRAVPLPPRVTEILTTHAATIKAIVEQKLAKKKALIKEDDDDKKLLGINDAGLEKVLTGQELQELLRQAFAEAQKEGGPFSALWEDIVDQ
jgi:ribosome assembly protein 1